MKHIIHVIIPAEFEPLFRQALENKLRGVITPVLMEQDLGLTIQSDTGGKPGVVVPKCEYDVIFQTEHEFERTKNPLFGREIPEYQGSAARAAEDLHVPHHGFVD